MNLSVPIAEEKTARAGAAVSKLASFFRRIASAVHDRRGARRLRLCEILPLGEKRFVAVVEYGAERFLLAGTPQRISLLKRFDEKEEPRGRADELRRCDGGPE